MHQNYCDVSSQGLSVKITIKYLFQAYPLDSAEHITRGKLPTSSFTTCSAKEMLHQGLKVKTQ